MTSIIRAVDNFDSAEKGKVIAIENTYHNTQLATTATTWSTVGTATYTPRTSSGYIYIKAVYHCSGAGSFRLLNNGSVIWEPLNGYFQFENYSGNTAVSWASSTLRAVMPIEIRIPNTGAVVNITTQFRSYNGRGFGINELTYQGNGVDFSGVKFTEVAG